MKKAVFCIASAAALVLSLTACKSPEEISQASQPQQQSQPQQIVIKQEVEPEERTLSVNGTGKVEAKPDLATIQLSVYVQAQTSDAAQTDNSAKMDAVIKAVKALGVEEKDIKTAEVSLTPLQGSSKNRQEITGYGATNTITVKLRDTAKAGQLVADATAAGANQVMGMTFDLEDETPAYRQALAMAVADAAEKAKIMAEAAGAELDGPILVQENGRSVTPMNETSMRMAAAADAESPAPVQSGQLTVSAEVTVQYKLKVAAAPAETPKP